MLVQPWDDPVSWLREFSRAREEFMSSPVRRLPDGAGLIRPTVYDSWRRSRLQGLRPEVVEPRYQSEVDVDSYLSRAVAPIVTRRATALSQGAYALGLTDREGRVLHRWVTEPGLGADLDALGVAAGSAMDESTIGTTALVALQTGAPEMLRGPEHFPEKFREFSCASVPIIHPLNRRLLGSVSLICRLRDTAPIMLPWLIEIVAAVEDALRLRAAQREQELFDAYTTYNRDARHPVVALDSTTIITNAAAARLLGGVDQSLLWEHARRSLVDRDGPSTLTLPDGQVLTVDCRPVSTEGYDAGAVLVIKKQPTSSGVAAPAIGAAAQLPRLVGHSDRWRALCRQAGGLVGAGIPVLVTGEPGTGRLAVARALHEWQEACVIDAADAFSCEPEQWCRELASHLDGSTKCLVIRHADLLSPSLALAVVATLRRGAPVRVLATAERTATDPSAHNAFLDSFTAVLEVPALRDRLEDLPDLLGRFTADATDGSSRVEWTREVVQTLSRLEWPRNLSSLDALVRRLLVNRADLRRIGVEHLPPEYRARGARRPLASLEQTEAHAILSALRAAGGNKNQAAQSLGIARSTLYRKVRALGLDLSSTVY